MPKRKQFGRRGQSLTLAFERSRSAELLTEREMAALLRVSQYTLRYWRRAGHGPAFVRLGYASQRRPRMIRYRRRDVDAYLAANLTKPEAR